MIYSDSQMNGQVAGIFLPRRTTARLPAATKYFRCPKGNKLIAVGKLEERHPRRTTITIPTLKASRSSSRLKTATPSGSEYIPHFPWVSPTSINFLPFRQKKRLPGRPKNFAKKTRSCDFASQRGHRKHRKFLMSFLTCSVSSLCSLWLKYSSYLPIHMKTAVSESILSC